MAGIDYEEIFVTEANPCPNLPSKKYPILEVEGQYIQESNAIARFFGKLKPETGLYGKTVFESSLVDQWLDYSVSLVDKLVNVIGPILGWMPADPKAYPGHVKDFKDCAKFLDGQIKGKQFFVGNQLTLADIRLGVFLGLGF